MLKNDIYTFYGTTYHELVVQTKMFSFDVNRGRIYRVPTQYEVDFIIKQLNPTLSEEYKGEEAYSELSKIALKYLQKLNWNVYRLVEVSFA